MATRRRKIVNGPSKWDLMLAMFCRFPSEPTKDIDFCLEGRPLHSDFMSTIDSRSSVYKMRPITLEQIGKVSSQDGEEIWSFIGRCFGSRTPNKMSVAKLEGQFCTQTRKGWLRVVGVTGHAAKDFRA